MGKYITKFIRWLRKGLRAFIMPIIISFLLYACGYIRDELFSRVISGNNDLFKSILDFLQDWGWMLPIIVITIYFIWAFYKVINEKTWDDIVYKSWYPSINIDIRCGISLYNDDIEDIKNVQATILSIDYPSLDAQPLNNKIFPLSLPVFNTQIEKDRKYEPVQIRQGNFAYFPLIYNDIENPNSGNYLIRAYKFMSVSSGECEIKVKLNANIKEASIRPLILLIKIGYKDGLSFIKEIEKYRK